MREGIGERAMEETRDESSSFGAAIFGERDRACWGAFLASVRVGGAIPVTFRLDDDCVVMEAIVPYVPPEPAQSADPNRIRLQIAEGFPVPISSCVKLPPFDARRAVHFVRRLVQKLYLHEVDEQLRVSGRRPFVAHDDDVASIRFFDDLPGAT